MNLGLTARSILFYTYTMLINGKSIGVTELSAILETSKPNISQIANQLRDWKYLEKRPYQHLILTKNGLNKAEEIYKRVLLIESFLFKTLSMSFVQCRTEAFQWEKDMLPSTIQYIENQINIATGLLGDLIPDKKGIDYRNALKPLNKVDIGTSCVICAFNNIHIGITHISELSKIYLETAIITGHDTSTGSILLICNQNKYILPVELSKKITVMVK